MGWFDDLSFWQEADFRGRMQWYREVAANRLPAKFRIAASLPAGVALARAPRREEIRAAFRLARERGIRFESLSYERNKTGFTL